MSDTAQAYAPFPYTTAEPTTITHPAATGHPLADALGAAVPFVIHDLIAQGGPSESDHEWMAAWRGLTEHGDDLLFRSQRKGESAKLFVDLVRVVSILAFAPGGISTFGTHYEAHVRAASDPAYAPSEVKA